MAGPLGGTPGKPVTRTGSLIAACLSLALIVAARPAHPEQTATATVDDGAASREARARAVARRIMDAARYCTLVTLDEAHRPQARIVDPLSPDDSFAVYIATNPLSRKVAEIRRDPRVTLLYFDAKNLGYVTLIGEATEVGEAEKRSHHKDDWQTFFPRETPSAYVLYRVVARRLEVVSAKDGFSGDPATWRPEIVELK